MKKAVKLTFSSPYDLFQFKRDIKLRKCEIQLPHILICYLTEDEINTAGFFNTLVEPLVLTQKDQRVN